MAPHPLTNFEIQKYYQNVIEHIPKEIKKIIENKNIKTNIYRIQACNLIMCGYFCIGFIYFMLKGKSLRDYTNFFLQMIMRRMIK